MTATATMFQPAAVPYSTGTRAPRLAMPADASDCHMHIYDARAPVAPGASLRPPDATVAQYRASRVRASNPL